VCPTTTTTTTAAAVTTTTAVVATTTIITTVVASLLAVKDVGSPYSTGRCFSQRQVYKENFVTILHTKIIFVGGLLLSKISILKKKLKRSSLGLASFSYLPYVCRSLKVPHHENPDIVS
jgi:hypothetical protein